MKQGQADLIRDIAGKVVELGRGSGDFTRCLAPLERAQDGRQFREAIFRMAKAHYDNGEAEPFIDCRDYVETLFPEGQQWHEIRDFLLICLYQLLHLERSNPERVADSTLHSVADDGLGSIDIITL